MTPSVGCVVHYVSYGTPGGEFKPACRAATVTEVDPADPMRVGLCVQNPTGLFFHGLTVGGCIQHELDGSDGQGEDRHRGGSWHWPERVG